MHFTKEDYKKIEDWLHRNSVKDTEFQEASPLKGDEIIAITQKGYNRKINVKDLVEQLLNLGIEDFINVTSSYDSPNISLEEAIHLIPDKARQEGQVITFLNKEGKWEIHQFTGKLNQWNNITLWNNPFDWENYVVNSILPDEEDLTKSLPDAEGNAYLSLKDRKYEPDKYSGLGRKILRRRVVKTEDPIYGTKEKNLLLQLDFAEDNTVYVVKYDFTLNGRDIILPDNSYIEYEGGSISDGNIIDKAGGLNRIVLNKNIVNGKNILTQEMVSKSNTIYEIRYDFDLDGQEIIIPEECVLDFQGGSFSNGTIIGNNTSINDNVTYNIFNDCVLKGFILPYVDIRWVGAIGDYNEITKEGSDNAPYFQRAFDNILEYHRGISLYISGKYLLKSSVIVSGDFNMKGNHHPTRNFIDSKAYADVDINSVETFPYGSSLSLIAVDRDIVGFNVIGYNNGSYNYNVMNISNIKFIGVDPKSSKAIYYTASGAPSRGGSIFQCEASKFLYFIHFDNKNNTIYAIMNIMECNIYNCGKAIYAYSSSTPNKYGLQHLNIQNNVIEHNGENCLYLTAVENVTIINNLFEGEDNPIHISTYYNHRSAVVIKRNYFERNKTGDTKIYVAGSIASNIHYFNTSVAISENTAIYDFKIILNYVKVVELDYVDFTSRFIGCCFEYGIDANKFGVFNISNYCLFSEYPETQNVTKINYLGNFGNDSVLQDNLGTSENKTSTKVIVKNSSKDMTFISILKFEVNSYPNLEPGHEAPIVTYGENYNNGHTEDRKFTIYERHPYYLVHKFTPYLDSPNYNLHFSINPATKSNVCLYQDVPNVYSLTDLPYYKNTNYIPNGNSSEYYSSNGNMFFDKNINKVKYCIGNLWIDNDGYTATLSKGTTSQRPNNLTPSDIGFMYFDTSLKKPIYAINISEGGNITWVDATGVEV